MAFTAEQDLAVKTALNKFLKACPICGNNSWVLPQYVYFVPLRGTVESGQPCVSAVCATCGAVQWFNVFTLGVADKFGITAAPAEAVKSDG